MAKRKEDPRIQHIRRILAERFPACFMAKREEKKPLAIGIHKQIIAAAPDLREDDVRLAIKDYVNGPKYWRNIRNGAVRVNVDGTPAGTVSKRQQGHAKARKREQERQWYLERKAKREASEQQFRKVA